MDADASRPNPKKKGQSTGSIHALHLGTTKISVHTSAGDEISQRPYPIALKLRFPAWIMHLQDGLFSGMEPQS